MKAKRAARRKTVGMNDWLLMGGGLIVVAALVLFVFARNSRRAPEASVAGTPPAPVSAAATPDPDHEHGGEAEVRRITALDLRSALDKGEAVVVDVRDVDSYAAGHIQGSMHIPLSFIESQVEYLPRGKMIVAYCT